METPKQPKSRTLDLHAAIAFARDPHGANYTEKEMRAFELGARRMLNYLYMNDLIAADEW